MGNVAQGERFETFLRLKALDTEDGERWLEGIATTPREDRMGDVVVPEGAKYALPLPLLAQHDHAAPIGAVVRAEVTKAGIRIRAKLTKGVRKADEIWQLVKDGAMSLSIGFQALKSTPLPSGGLRFDSWSWHELSVVSVPCNPDAKVQIAKCAAYATRKAVEDEPIRDIPPALDRTWTWKAQPRLPGESEWDANERRFDAALSLLPAEMRGFADIRRCGMDGNRVFLDDPFGKRMATIDLVTKAVHYPVPDTPVPSQRKEAPRKLAPAGMTPSERELLFSVSKFAKQLEEETAGAILDLLELVKRLESKVEERGFHYRGYYRSGMTAKKGEAFTNDGSLWIAMRDTEDPPRNGSADWNLLARKGRDA